MGLESHPKVGRSNDEQLSQRILDGALALLSERGYAALSMEQVAKEVGCGKSAIYRRYPDKAALVAATVKAQVQIGPIPDTGDVRADLLALVLENQQNQVSSPDLSHGLLAMFEPEVFPLLWESFFKLRRAQGAEIIDRAIARGELPDDVHHDIILDTLAGLTLYRQSVKQIHIARQHYIGLIDALVSSPPLRLSGPAEKSSDVR